MHQSQSEESDDGFAAFNNGNNIAHAHQENVSNANGDDFWGEATAANGINANADDGFGGSNEGWENFNSNNANSTTGFHSFDQSDDSATIFASAPGRQDASRQTSSYWDGSRAPSMMQTQPDMSSQSSSVASSQGTNNLFGSANGTTYANTNDLLGSFSDLDFNSNSASNDMLQPMAPNTSQHGIIPPGNSQAINSNSKKINSDPLLGLVNLNDIATPPGKAKSSNTSLNRPMNEMNRHGNMGMLTPTQSHVQKAAAIRTAFQGSTPIQPRMNMGYANNNFNLQNQPSQGANLQQQQQQQNKNPFDAFGL